jgi:putative transposase
MAETKRMTAEQVVSYLLEEDGLDFLREPLTWVVQQLMEAEVSELVGAARGERAPEEHFLREALGHARREQQPMLAALIRPIFTAADGERARAQVTAALERLQEPLPKIHELLAEAEDDLLAFYAFPADHWPKLRSTNPLERVNREIGRRTDVVGIFPNDRSLIRLAASIVIEQNDEWLVGRRYLSNHTLDALLDREKEDEDREETRELTAA